MPKFSNWPVTFELTRIGTSDSNSNRISKLRRSLTSCLNDEFYLLLSSPAFSIESHPRLQSTIAHDACTIYNGIWHADLNCVHMGERINIVWQVQLVTGFKFWSTARNHCALTWDAVNGFVLHGCCSLSASLRQLSRNCCPCLRILVTGLAFSAVISGGSMGGGHEAMSSTHEKKSSTA